MVYKDHLVRELQKKTIAEKQRQFQPDDLGEIYKSICDEGEVFRGVPGYYGRWKGRSRARSQCASNLSSRSSSPSYYPEDEVKKEQLLLNEDDRLGCKNIFGKDLTEQAFYQQAKIVVH